MHAVLIRTVRPSSLRARSRRPDPRSRRAGFAAVDALVGLTLLSMTLALALAAQASVRRVALQAGEVRAASVLIRSLLDRDPPVGRRDVGVTGALSWTVTLSPLPDQADVCEALVEVRSPRTQRSWRAVTWRSCPEVGPTGSG